MDQCSICNEQKDESSATLTTKESDSINKASESRGLQLRTVPGQKVHTECRKVHCSQSSIDAFNRKRKKTVHRTHLTSCGQLNQHLNTRHTVYYVKLKTCIMGKG